METMDYVNDTFARARTNCKNSASEKLIHVFTCKHDDFINWSMRFYDIVTRKTNVRITREITVFFFFFF